MAIFKTRRKEEQERKEELLQEALGRQVKPPETETHLQRLLQSYAAGEDHREEIADNIVAEFRPVLRKKDGGPNYDGPLYARLMEALESAEKNGRAIVKAGELSDRPAENVWMTGKTISEHGVFVEDHPFANGRLISRQLFSPDEVQRCLFCQREYRPAVEKHECSSLSS